MKKVEESGEGTAVKRENLGEKLRRAGRKRGGQITPVASFWRPKELQLLKEHQAGSSSDQVPFEVPRFSARKLAATLWELHHYRRLFDQMHNGAGVPLPRLRRLNHHQELYKEKGGAEHDDPSPSSPDLPGSSGTLRRHIAASLLQHHRSAERNNHAIQPVSPTSYGSSMEIAPYHPATTPSSSIELRGRNGASLRTSTELLKVLNRIWSLEEQHVSNITLVKALKKDLDHARSQIKTLIREQQSDRHEMDEVMKQIAEGKLVRKNNKEQDRINSAVQSMRDELEGERKLRKRSESLHRKLARELYDVKTTLANVSEELENERKSCNLLEDLCDEFALGVRDYEKELHGLRKKSDADWSKRDDLDRLILHLSESWLDERMQVNMQEGGKKSVVEKLSSEIEAFLRSRRSGNNNNNNTNKINSDHVKRDRRNSLESIPMNTAVSAPRDEDDDEADSAGNNSYCFELEKASAPALKDQENEQKKDHSDGKKRQVKKKLGFSDREIDDVASGQGNNNPVEMVSISQKPEKRDEAAKENSSERKYEGEGISGGMDSNDMIENLIRNHQYLLSESGKKQQPDKGYGVASSSAATWRGQPSPVRQWTEKLPSRADLDSLADVEATKSSSRVQPELKENTLMAKLYEARKRGQRSHGRLKASSTPARNG